MKISIYRNQPDGTKTVRRWPLSDVFAEITGTKLRNITHSTRMYYPNILRMKQSLRKNELERYADGVHRLCFATGWHKKNGIVKVEQYYPLLLMTISNLRDEEVAENLRRKASQLPYTRLAFVDIAGHGVNIVAELMPLGKNVDFTDEEQTSDLLCRGFAQLRKVYADFMQCSVDIVEPSVDSYCLMAHDEEAYFNGHSTPYPVDMKAAAETFVPAMSPEGNPLMQSLPGSTDDRTRWRRVYISNLEAARDKVIVKEKIPGTDIIDGDAVDRREDDPVFQILLLLARYCHETGVPQAMAAAFASLEADFMNDPALVRETFAAEYSKDVTPVSPLKHFNSTQLLVMRTNHFMNTHFRLRRNVLNGQVEYRMNDGSDFRFHPLTEEVQNTMTIMANEAGLPSWDKDMKRFIHSKRIEEYDPVNSWLDRLPEWDGTDRLTAFAQRIPTSTPHWTEHFSMWMRSMVAQWMGRDDLYGNAIAPILIGRQGTGKSSFCRIILPPELLDYYNDGIHFKDDKSVFLALSSQALVNIDEFDSVSKSNQPVLKYLMSKADVKFRAAYRSHIEQHKRYASFIATTNKLQPLSDPTGSRRFVCVMVDGPIDHLSPVDYRQLYAQLRHEVLAGERYWFTPEECESLIRQNTVFQKDLDLKAMLASIYRHPGPNDADPGITTPQDIIAELTTRFPGLKLGENANTRIGMAMKSAGFEQVRTYNKRGYRVIVL